MGALPDTWLAIDSAYGHSGVVSPCKGRREGILVDGLRYIRYVYVNENEDNIYIARQFWFIRVGRPLRIPRDDIEIIHSPYMGLFPYEMKLRKIKGLELRISSGLAHVLGAEAGVVADGSRLHFGPWKATCREKAWKVPVNGVP